MINLVYAQKSPRVKKLKSSEKGLSTCLKRVRVVMSAGDTHLLAKTLTISGKDGDDAPRYLEKQVASALRGTGCN